MKRLALLAVALVAAGCGSTTSQTSTQALTTTATTTQAGTAPCMGSDLTASFAELAGSAGAGHISYILKLTNTSASTCAVRFVGVQLLDAKGNDVPTLAAPSAIPTDLRAGASRSYEARFSPDIAGVGDNQTGACEPVATTIRVLVGSDTVDAPIKPPTSVCEQGSIQFRAAG